MQTISYYFNNPKILLKKLLDRCSFMMSDRLFLSLKFRINTGYSMDWKNPKTYNQKLQYLKLYDHKPIYTTMVDKVAVKKYVAEKIGVKYVIPNYVVWNRVEEIDIESLPNEFVIKISHGGGSNGVLVCKDKRCLDVKEVRRMFRQAMKQDGAKYNKEWPYKNVPHRILAEKLLVEQEEPSPRDYKVMCFNGEAKLIEFHSGRFSDDHRQDFYDCNWNLTGITQGSYGGYNTIPSPKPELLDEMIKLSRNLAEGIPHVRVDWYIINNHLYFGEMTFFDGSGFCPFDRYEDDLLLGSWITLPQPII